MMTNLSPKNPELPEPISEPLFPELTGLQYPWTRSEEGLDENDTYAGRCVE